MTKEHTDELRWYCTQCSALVGVEDYGSIPKECPECTYYHCGDMDCCVGEGFTTVMAKMMGLDNDENKPEDYCAKCGAELEPGDHPFEELCDTCKAELARRWKRIVDDNVPRGTPPDAEPTRPGKIKKSVASPTVEHLDKGDIRVLRQELKAWRDTAEAFATAAYGDSSWLPHAIKLHQEARALSRCKSCDGTGDLTSIDGQWLGKCPCGKST